MNICKLDYIRKGIPCSSSGYCMSIIEVWDSGSHSDVFLRAKTTYGGRKSKANQGKIKLKLSSTMAAT